jgi:predicted RNase H-like HicB family nuclease
MLTAYIRAAMQRAHYELLEENEGYFGSIPDCPGVWANAETLEACREELQDVLEGWIILGLRTGDPLPVIDGINLTPPLQVMDTEEQPAPQPTAS